VEARIAEGLTASVDPTLMRTVLENLLGNAWKFTGKKDGAVIEFGANMIAGERVYHIRDNGAGFNMEYQKKLFTAFQRLHRTDEFEGTGVGLASVQRIILLHGGRIWAEGEEAQGATFYFTLGDAMV
jgi:light-regulated signal transduction histidine kinase (bacteriophytochrome)